MSVERLEEDAAADQALLASRGRVEPDHLAGKEPEPHHRHHGHHADEEPRRDADEGTRHRDADEPGRDADEEPEEGSEP